MKILVVTQYYYPEQFRITDICEELVRRGHDVTVLTGIPNYPEGEVFNGYEKGKKNKETVNGVKVIRCDNKPRHKGLIKLAVNYISFVRKANKAITSLIQHFDLAFVYELSPITMAIPAIKLKRMTGTPIYLYCLDIWPESVRDISHNRTMRTTNPIYILAYWISKGIYNAVDMIGVKNYGFIKYLLTTCKVEEKRIQLLYEHAENDYLEVNEDPIENGCYDFFFFGNIGYSQNCEIIIRAVEQINTKSEYRVHFVGDGSDKQRLKVYVERKGLSDIVIFHGKFPLRETLTFYNQADCCLLTLSDRTESGITVPGKTLGYMGASRPIIASASGETKTLIEKADCGICVESGDIQCLAEAMTFAIEHQKEFSEKGKNGRAFFLRNYTLDTFIENLIRQFVLTISNSSETK